MIDKLLGPAETSHGGWSIDDADAIPPWPADPAHAEDSRIRSARPAAVEFDWLINPAAAGGPARIVELAVLANLKTAAAAIEAARNLLDHGPGNQLFALLAKGGMQRPLGGCFPMDLLQTAKTGDAVAERALRLRLAIDYLQEKKIPSVDALAGHVYEPGLVAIRAGLRTGMCHDYAFVAMLSAMEEMLKAGRPFDLRLIGLARSRDGKPGRHGDAWEAPHEVATLAMPSESDPHRVVVIDPWVERARPALLPEVQYGGGLRRGVTERPTLQVLFDGDAIKASALAAPNGEAPVPVDIRTWPTMDELQEVKGRISADDFLKHLATARQAALASGDNVATGEIDVFRSLIEARCTEMAAVFDTRTRKWKEQELRNLPVYQVQHVPGNPAQLYRTASGSR